MSQRFLLILSGIAILPLAGSGIHSFHDAALTESEVRQFHSALIDTYAQECDQFFRQLNLRLSFTVDFENRPAMKDYEKQALLLNVMTYHKDFQAISYVDKEGRTELHSEIADGFTLTPQEFSKQLDFKNAVRRQAPVMSGPFQKDGHTYTRIYYPLSYGPVIIITTTLEPLLKRLRSLALGKTGRVWLWDAENKTVLGESHFDTTWVQAEKNIPSVGWRLAFVQDPAEAFQTTRRMRQNAGWWLGVGLMGILLGGWALTHDLSRALETKRVREEFFQMMAHDLRAPLTAVRSYTRLLLQNYADQLPEAPKELVLRCDQVMEELLETVANILDVRKYENERIPLTIDPVPVRKVLEEIQARHAPAFQMRHLKFIIATPPDAGLMDVDKDLLKRVLNNLLGNAAKFTPEGGSIRLEVQAHSQALLFAVQDTGRGIPSEHLDQIFEKYKQTSTEDRITGTGLGLSICKMIVDAHGGKISVTSEVGKGTRFEIRIPRTQPDDRSRTSLAA